MAALWLSWVSLQWLSPSSCVARGYPERHLLFLASAILGGLLIGVCEGASLALLVMVGVLLRPRFRQDGAWVTMRRLSLMFRLISWRTHINLTLWFYSVDGWQHLYECIRREEFAILLEVAAHSTAFACALPETDDFPDDSGTKAPLVVNPKFICVAESDLQPDSASRKNSVFQRTSVLDPKRQVYLHPSQLPVILVEDTNGVIYCYSVPAGEAAQLLGLSRGRVSPSSLSEGLRNRLCNAKVLVTTEWMQRTSLNWSMRTASANKLLRKQGYARVNGVIRPHYLRAITALGRQQLGSHSSSHADIPVLSLLSRSLTPWVATVQQEDAVPRLLSAFPNLLLYKPHVMFPLHVDDATRYEFGISIAADVNDDATEGLSWPLSFISRSGITARAVDVRLQVGEAVVFRGCQLPHFRRQVSTGFACRVLVLAWRRDNPLTVFEAPLPAY